MIKKSFIVLIALLLFGPNTYAQDEADERYPAAFPFDFTTPGNQEKLEQKLGIENEEQTDMKTAAAYANRFYVRCMEEGTDHRYRDEKTSVCTCTAAGIMEIMSEEEIIALPEGSYQGLLQRERAITLAYVPCFEPVLIENLEDICNADVNLRRRYKNSAKLCSCYANRLGAYAFPQYTQIFWQKAQNSQPLYVKDMLAEIIAQPRFTTAANSLRRQCIYQEVYDWGNIDG